MPAITTDTDLTTAAIAYAEAGYYVFPVSITLNAQGRKESRLINNWDEVSTRDPQTLTEWFSTGAWTGLAIDTGKSGVVAVDLDEKDGVSGSESWAALPAQQDTPMVVITQSGGRHFIYRDSSNGQITNSASKVGPAIDIRGVGGLLYAAPTKVLGGGAYELANGLTPVDELPALSPDMVEIILVRQNTRTPRYNPDREGPYQTTESDGRGLLARRAEILERGEGGARAAVFGYAFVLASLEAGIAIRDGVDLDPESVIERAMFEVESLTESYWPHGLNDDDIKWIEEGVEKGVAAPWEVIDEAATPAPMPEDIPLEDLLQLYPPTMPGDPRAEHGLAATRIVEELAGRYLYVEGLGWHGWDGARWSPNPPQPVRDAVAQISKRRINQGRQKLEGIDRNVHVISVTEALEALRAEKAKLPRGEGLDAASAAQLADLETTEGAIKALKGAWSAFVDWWRGMTNGYNYREVMRFVEESPGKIFIYADKLDADPFLLNCENGTVDLRTGVLKPHDPMDYITKSTGLDYRPDAQHELWDKAREAFAPGIEGWLQRRVGEGTRGKQNADDAVMFSFGNGANGKSTLAGAITSALGDYAVVLHDKALLGNEHDHGTERMVFRGARWSILEELPEGQVLRSNILKKLFGTAVIRARLMRQDTVEFTATHSTLVNSNHRPQVLEFDHGTWRRLIAVPWPFTFKPEGEELHGENDRRGDHRVRDAILSDKAVKEAALAWIVRGSVMFEEDGQSCGLLPQVVKDEIAAWRGETDTFGSFFEERLCFDPKGAVSSSQVLAEYNMMLQGMGKREVSIPHIAQRVKDLPGGSEVDTGATVRKAVKKYTVTSPQGGMFGLPDRFKGWVGVRWRTASELAEVPTGEDD